MSLVALVGLPNSGKSSLFNALTNSRQRIANFPGITTEKKLGTLIDSDKSILDLPGVYTLDAATLDEKVTRDFIFNKVEEEKADLLVLVMDATNLKKSLYLALQLKEINQSFVLALNMMDLATKRGQELDLEKLSQHLGGVSVFPVTAVSGQGLDDLTKRIQDTKIEKREFNIPKDYQTRIKRPEYVKEKLAQIEQILDDITINNILADSLTEKLDRIFLHPWLGPVILILILLFMFQLLFTWSDPLMGGIESLFSMLGDSVSTLLPDGYLKSLIVDGVIAGVGGILVFLPHIVFLFLIIYFLEDFGYLGRVAFSLDYLMRKMGLPGKAVVPMLSSHACAIPGIMSARIIEDPSQRLITMMVSPLTTCSARLPVYTLLIGVMIPKGHFLGPFSLQALTLFGLYALGIVSAFIVAIIARKTYLPTSPAYLLMELPPYRVPSLLKILKQSLMKGWIFIKKAGTVILFLSIVIWGLVSFPNAPEGADQPAVNYSYAAKIGKTFEPIFRPLGYDWRLTTALIPSFAAREVMVAAMGTVYAVQGEDAEEESFLKNLSSILSSQYSLATMMSLLIWFVFAPQCISTFAVLKKETGGYKYPLIFMGYTLAMAYIFAFLTYLAFK